MSIGYVVCIGRNTIDEYYRWDHYPALGDKIVVDTLDAVPGGFMANTIAVTASLGNECYMMDVLGDDKYTQLLLDNMKKNNVKADFVEFQKNVPNSKTMIFMLGNEKTIILFKNQKHAQTINDRSLKLLRGAAFVYSNMKDLRGLDNYQAVIEDFTSNGASLFVDAETSTFTTRKSERFFFEKARILSLNEFALAKYCAGDDESVLDELLTTRPDKILLLTLGDKGCKVLTPTERFTLPAIPVTPVDTTGAGDTFNGAFMHGLLRGWDIKKTARFANAAAARSITLQGPQTGAVPEAEVLRFMEEKGVR